MANKIVDGRLVTTPARARKQRSFALAADKPPLFRLSRAEIGRFTVRTATSQSRVDEVVAPAAEEIATGIAAAIDFLFPVSKKTDLSSRSPSAAQLVWLTSIVANRGGALIGCPADSR